MSIAEIHPCTNKLFCYWLQGYFEIERNVAFQRKHVVLIKKKLKSITEPFGPFISWLDEVCNYIASLDYSNKICEHFSPIIQHSLNSIFYHVIDNSYETEIPKEKLLQIHAGESK